MEALQELRSLTQFLGRHQNFLSAACRERFIGAYEAFLLEFAAIDDDQIDRSDKRLSTYVEFFSQCQRRYLAIKEREANDHMMKTGVGGVAGTVSERIIDGFGREAYERVRDLNDMVDFGACRDVVMVGSGAFPATLFWLRDNFPALRYTGLDVDPGCVQAATNLAQALGIDNVRFVVVDGSDFNFSSADFVYVANHVTPKKAVLQQISRSGLNAQVVVREPTRRGQLLAEAVREELPSAFIVRSSGIESRTFLSYDLLLRRA